MKCPSCGEDDDKVLESRAVRGGAAIRRRRVCLRCGHRFTTYEEVLRDSMMVVKRDGRLEEFSRAKLENGIQRSCLKRPISLQRIGTIVDRIIEDLETRYELEIPAQAIESACETALTANAAPSYKTVNTLIKNRAEAKEAKRPAGGNPWALRRFK